MTDFTAWDADLYHFGIRGQKWGQRRWQNEDGSLTPAGRERYGTVENYNRLMSARKKTKYMTDEELRQNMERIRAEKEYKELRRENNTGYQLINKISEARKEARESRDKKADRELKALGYRTDATRAKYQAKQAKYNAEGEESKADAAKQHYKETKNKNKTELIKKGLRGALRSKINSLFDPNRDANKGKKDKLAGLELDKKIKDLEDERDSAKNADRAELDRLASIRNEYKAVEKEKKALRKEYKKERKEAEREEWRQRVKDEKERSKRINSELEKAGQQLEREERERRIQQKEERRRVKISKAMTQKISDLKSLAENAKKAENLVSADVYDQKALDLWHQRTYANAVANTSKKRLKKNK